jgi:hypothetical protein
MYRSRPAPHQQLLLPSCSTKLLHFWSRWQHPAKLYYHSSTGSQPQRLLDCPQLYHHRERQIPGFSDLANSDEASCLCYSSKSWNPNGFDVPWSSCVAWAKTANTTAYPDLASDAGLCASVGNILKAPASGTASTTAAASSSVNNGKTAQSSVPAKPVGGSGSSTTPTSAKGTAGSITATQISATATVGSTAAVTATTTTVRGAGIRRYSKAVLAIQVMNDF